MLPCRQVPGTCPALPRVFTYTVTCSALINSYYRVISGEGCVSLVMVNWQSLLLRPEALHTTGMLLIHTAILGTCHARHVLGKISFALIVPGMYLECFYRNTLKNIGLSRAWHVPGTDLAEWCGSKGHSSDQVWSLT